MTICNTCGQDKKLHAKSGQCGNCYNKALVASKSHEEQERIRANQRRLKAAWQKAHPDKVAQYTKKSRNKHPNTIKKAGLGLAKFIRERPIRILHEAGIDTPFMRQQLEEHRKQKLMRKIEAGMEMIGL